MHHFLFVFMIYTLAFNSLPYKKSTRSLFRNGDETEFCSASIPVRCKFHTFSLISITRLVKSFFAKKTETFGKIPTITLLIVKD